ncbi:molybdate-binding protein [Nocardioides psychrotolerans]|uniref:Molybdate transport system substrate-binding protein n=1 Tax=Nocardioides psychrotolerans TaxID=1005945 RepID=A0A1I3IKN2_9ACTN|nr:molybdate ABC transporter substrate-binding protein [Nocardioides psychrotolerans]GEP38046.1 molybdate-binding protein [Nocardioides psychrotolerans]SFI48548.1 molybdate transport system substrate-binding protein [Nocardioides psychrotolerans]
MSTTTVRRSLALLALLLPLTACGSDEGEDSGRQSDGDTTITVLAAASLTDTFTALAEDFEAEHEGVTVKLAFDSSATLAEQALGGAPADVLATADTATMDDASEALAADPQLFATNTMVLALPADNPAGITSYDDLGSGDVTYVVCVDTAPCGKVAAALIESTGLEAEPSSLEVDVKAVLSKVITDEADAGFVYATDAVAAGDAVSTVEIPGAAEQVTSYPIAPLVQSQEADLAQEFVDLVLSEAGQQTLTDAGFGPPS